jgi:hypothetical protein
MFFFFYRTLLCSRAHGWYHSTLAALAQKFIFVFLLDMSTIFKEYFSLKRIFFFELKVKNLLEDFEIFFFFQKGTFKINELFSRHVPKLPMYYSVQYNKSSGVKRSLKHCRNMQLFKYQLLSLTARCSKSMRINNKPCNNKGRPYDSKNEWIWLFKKQQPRNDNLFSNWLLTHGFQLEAENLN